MGISAFDNKLTVNKGLVLISSSAHGGDQQPAKENSDIGGHEAIEFNDYESNDNNVQLGAVSRNGSQNENYASMVIANRNTDSKL